MRLLSLSKHRGALAPKTKVACAADACCLARFQAEAGNKTLIHKALRQHCCCLDLKMCQLMPHGSLQVSLFYSSVSIHAPRVECYISYNSGFNPRIPRGVRPSVPS